MSSLNRLPLNQSTVSKPPRPPDAIARKSSPASSPNRRGAGSACRSIRVNMWSGSRPTSSANMQKTRRLTKCATAGGLPALAERLGDGRERRRHALGERLPGLPWPQTLRLGERPLQPVAGRRIGQVVELELVRPADAVRPVGADPEPRHVGHDEQRRILKREGRTAGARVPTPFVRWCTLRARPEPSGGHEAVERGPGHARELVCLPLARMGLGMAQPSGASSQAPLGGRWSDRARDRPSRAVAKFGRHRLPESWMDT